MNTIYIYGPPAVWKLTTAKELSKITWYKIFHNHLTLDLVNSIFNKSENENLFYSMVDKINLLILSELPKNIKWIIITQCYEEKYDKEYIKKITTVTKESKNNIYFVKLNCNQDELLKRVEMEDRKNTKKLSNKNNLSELLKNWDINGNVIDHETLEINNNNKWAIKVAEEIKMYYKL